MNDYFACRLGHFDCLADALHLGSARQFLAIFVHPGHFENGGRHRHEIFAALTDYLSNVR